MAFWTLQLADSALLDVVEGSLSEPLLGLWTARLWFAEDAAPTERERATLLIAAENGTPAAFAGTMVVSRFHEGRAYVELVGAAGLLGEATAAHYTSAPTPVEAADVVQDIATGAGVALAADVLAGLAGLSLGRWTRVAGESWATALDRLAERFGLSWRALPDGSVWLGSVAWSTGTDPWFDREDSETSTLHVGFDAATMRPGTTLLGRRIVRVIYHDTGRAELVYEADEERLFAALVGRLSRTSPYAKTYVARVVLQHSDDGSLDVHVLEGPVTDLTRVPFWVGVEGARVVIPDDALVHVEFEGGRPDGAVARGRPNDQSAQRGIARKQDHTVNGTITLTGGPTGLVVTYTGPTGTTSVAGTITGVVSGSPVVFAGVAQIALEGLIDTASEEVFLR